jgi:U3 small nucleolar RNA-associated protein 25
LKRFIDEFGPSESDHISNPHKPKDFNQTFEGNIDDCYKIGLKFQRKNVKLYSNFQTSDILIVSPLGLKLIIGEEGDKKRDFDYLSSIEILMVWHPHIYLMQNWEHFKSIYDHLNLIPIHQQSCDFSRVKTHVLEGNAKMTRQTLVCSDSQFAELSSFINTCSNHSGSVRISSKIPGQILNVTSKTPQVFIRINTPLTVSELPDARFDNFIKIILPKLIHKPKTLLFIPSYYDFVRVRLHLKNHNYSFVAVSEYSPKAHVDQSRHFFNNGKVPLMVFTERLHFFRRYNFSCEDLIFYSPAVFAKGYEQLVAFSDSTCMVYWSVYDRFAMERIVGSDRCEKMVKAERDQYMFTL